MRRPRQTFDILNKLRNAWRLPSPGRSPERSPPQLVVRQLEERRVLTVGAGAGLVLAAAETGVQGTDLGPQATPLIEAAAPTASTAHDLTAPPGQSSDSAQSLAGSQLSQDATGDAPALAPAISPQVDDVALIAPILTVADDQATDEGSLLTITNIGSFSDAPSEVPGEPLYTYTIDWGDGTPFDSGAATIDSIGATGSPILGSFDGTHTYADNGVYTVTITIASQLGESSGTLAVTVENVTPTLTVAPDQTIDEGSELSITDIGNFTDPGFDNPLNVGGETSERFTFAVDWGDGTELDSGLATIDVPGAPGVLTKGSFDGAHTYADNGIYTVTVTISDDDGGSVSDTFTVTVNNVTPTLTVAPDQVIDEGSELSITDVGSFTDPGFDNPLNEGGETTERFTFAVDWGDGSNVDSGPATIDVPGAPGVLTKGSFDGAHTYADNGIYTVTVTISDDDGGSVSDTFTVTVNNVTPTLEVPGNQVVDEGTTLNITNLGQFTDPGFDNPNNVGGETTERFTFAINWGDGSDVDSGPATIDVPGSVGTPTAGSFDGAHTFADNGIYTVTVTISDDDGGSVSQTFLVTVGNVAPTLTVAPDKVVDEGTPLTIPNVGQFTDPGFDNPNNVGGPTTEEFSFTIDWGDGSNIDSGPATIDVPGGIGVPTTGSFGGSHTYADNGVYTVTVSISDDDGGSTSDTFAVTVNNVTPTLVAAGNQASNEGELLSITNIGQFTDPGFDNPNNVGGETTERFTFSIDWGDGSNIDSGPATIDMPGSAGVLTAGSFDGAHAYSASGIYTVTITVSDDDGGTAVATLQVSVGNTAPLIVAAPDQTMNEGSPLSITNIGSFTDAHGRSDVPGDYAFTIDWGDGTPLDSGAATIDVPGGPGVPTAGSFDGAHVYADNGLYAVTVTITDPDGNTASDTLTVTVDNVAPALTVAPDQIAGRGALLSIANIGQYSDPGFDNPNNVGGETTERFTFAVDWGDGSEVDSGPAAINVPGTVGVLTSGSFNGQHTYANGGIYTVTVTVSDDDGGTTSDSFKVYIGPTLTTAGHQTVDEGSLLFVSDIGQFIDPAPAGLIPGGGQGASQFNFSINWGDGTSVDTGSATIDVAQVPGGATAGSFDGVHIYADNGLYTVTLSITSADGRVDVTTITVTVNNVAPTLVSVPNQTVAQTRPLAIPDIGQFTDPGFDNPLNAKGETTERFTFSINWGDGTVVSSGPGAIDHPGSPGVLTAGSFDGTHTFAAAGTFTVTVTVSDDDGGSATQTFQVVVGLIGRDILFSTPGVGAGTTQVAPPVSLDRTPQPSTPVPINQSDVRTYRIGSVAGAEPRLVLRIVRPSGEEAENSDEPLSNGVLDNLRTLFERLPDGRYRIYLIQPDGIERLVVDVIVREGRSLDSADESDDAVVVPPNVVEPEGDSDPNPAEQPRATEMGLIDDGEADLVEVGSLDGTLALGGGFLTYAATGRHQRLVARLKRRADERPLSKARRLLNRLR
jgi:PKD repeat protein